MKIPNLDVKNQDDDDGYVLKWPFRMIVVGNSSRGKTNLVMYMILSTKFFNKPDIAYYYGRNILQDKIQYLKSISDKIKSKIGYDFIVLENDPNNIPYTNGYKDNDAKKLVTFDDLMGMSKNVLKRISDHYIFGRQKNIFCIFLAQHYTDIDQVIRLNSCYMIIYEPKTKKHMRMVLRENYIDENAFKNLHGEGHKHDLIFINKNNDKCYKHFDEEI